MPHAVPAPSSFYRLASPNYFYRQSGRLLPWLALLTVLLFTTGLVWGLAFAPADYQQGNGFRIMYVHVPAAVFSMSVYVAMAVAGGIGLIWRLKVAAMVARSCAPIGAAFTFLALATGSLWGKPMWGAWWVWDARLTSELILLFLYLGYMALQEAIEERDTADRAGAVLALVGLINIPIIHYSVEWWYTLHQGATILKLGKPSIAPAMLWPLLVMLAAYGLLALLVVLLRTRNEVLERKLNG
ncbi:MAG: heme ABC transporter permease [Candidatus Competibacteraceae bacterium]